jgi:hypothetical protein
LVRPNFDQSYVAFNSAADGWLYGGSLYKTTDAGLAWHRVPIAGLLISVGSVVTDGRYTWVDEQPKSTTKANLEQLVSVTNGHVALLWQEKNAVAK